MTSILANAFNVSILEFFNDGPRELVALGASVVSWDTTLPLEDYDPGYDEDDEEEAPDDGGGVDEEAESESQATLGLSIRVTSEAIKEYMKLSAACSLQVVITYIDTENNPIFFHKYWITSHTLIQEEGSRDVNCNTDTPLIISLVMSYNVSELFCVKDPT